MFEKCLSNEGCKKIVVDAEGNQHCGVFPVPEAKWRTGSCPMATNLPKVEIVEKKKNPLKASKQKAKGA